MKWLFITLTILLLLAAGCAQTTTVESKPAPAPAASTTPAPPATQPPAPVTPAVPAPAPSVEKPMSYESERYTNDAYGFSIRYPKAWASWKPPLKTSVFLASEKIQQPDKMVVVVDVRPADSYKEASRNLVAELIEWKASDAMYVPIYNLVSESTTQLPDNKTVAYDQCWGIASYRVYCYGVLRDGKAIMVIAGWDEAQSDLYKEIIHTLTLK